MLGQDSLARAVRSAGIDAPPRFLEETGSTNAVALELAAAGAPEWTVVAAGHQTAGRGRLGRSWADAPGRALLFSVILRPPVPAGEAPVLSLLAAERMAAACETATGVPVRTKWPNDLVVRERKLAGILPEARVAGARVEHLVVGIGVNVAMEEDDFPPELRTGATSLAREGAEVTPEALLAAFLAAFHQAYRPDAPAFAARVAAAYAARCTTIGRAVRARTVTDAVVEGEAVGVTEHGDLLVRAGAVEHVVAFGEVEHLGAPAPGERDLGP